VRYLLTFLAVVLYVIGWTIGKVSLVFGWAWSAVMVGWDDARRQTVKV
jgi:hypothetical protein